MRVRGSVPQAAGLGFGLISQLARQLFSEAGSGVFRNFIFQREKFLDLEQGAGGKKKL